VDKINSLLTTMGIILLSGELRFYVALNIT